MLQVALASIAGAWFALYGNGLPDSAWSAFAPVCFFFAWLLPARRFVLVFVAVYLFACVVLQFHLAHSLDEEYDNRIVEISGEIVGLPEVGAERIRFELRPSRIDDYPPPLPRRVRLNWYQTEQIPAAGEHWRLQVKLRRPRGLINPGGFDYAGWAFTRGIDAVGYVRRQGPNRRLAGARPWQLDSGRAVLAAAIHRHCADCRQLGLIKALALGFRGDIPDHHAELLIATATAHLLAISGLHVGLVAAAGYWIGVLIWRMGACRYCEERRRIAIVVSFACALLYAALAGFSLPTLRALCMLSVLLLVGLMRGRTGLLQSLAIAVTLLVLSDPRVVGSVSFWLSVSALLVIGLASLRLRARDRWWRQLVLLQVHFALLTVPLGALFFAQVAPAGFFANLVAVPAVSILVLPLVLVAVLSSGCDVIAMWVLSLADLILEYLLVYLDWLNSDVLVVRSAAVWPPALALCLIPLLAGLVLPLAAKMRLLLCCPLLCLLSWQPRLPGSGEFDLYVLDVGMGSSILLRTRNHSLVYDFGPGRKNAFRAADWSLLPALRHFGISRPDMMVASHADSDHSGGLHSMSALTHQQLILSGTPRELTRRFQALGPVRDCHAYPPWRWDGVQFRFLDAVDLGSSGNNRSCVLVIEGRHRVLLPGDIEFGREQALVETLAEALRADLLLAPHHGSATSSSAAFLAAAKPAHAVISAGLANRWGFPQAPVLSRYRDVGSHVWRTDLQGAIRVQSRAEGLFVRPWIWPQQRLWRRW